MVITEILSTVFIYDPSLMSRSWIYVINCIYYTSTNFLALICCRYCLAKIEYFETADKKNAKWTKILFISPFLVCICVIWGSFIFDGKFVGPFYLDSNNCYQRGTIWFYFCYITAFYYVVFTFRFLFKYKKRITEEKIKMILAYIIACMFAAFVQMLFPNMMMECFIISLATLLFEISIRHPEEVIDNITGLINQTGFVKTSSKLLKNQVSYYCIGVILDDVIFLSNTFGIPLLNKIIKHIADTFLRLLKQTSIYHIGQGQFALIVKGQNKEVVQNIVSTIQNLFKHSWKINSIEVKLYARITIINCPKDINRAEDIFDIFNLVSEDERYKTGLVYASEIDIEYKRRSAFIEHALRNGLYENKFEVYYQPIYSTNEKMIIGAEALVRLRDDEGNFISPEIFIPIAEKTGTILHIGEFVFETVCKTLSEIVIEEYGIKKIDINLSVAQCMQEILAEQILAIRSMYRIPSSVINLEITETAMAHTPEIMFNNLIQLTEAGIELSLDDYGSGYSNMNYMLELPFKMIKIDKGIVWAAANEERANKALKATISMIKELDMTVLAEGVETEAQSKWLTNMGCDYLQGYYYSKPIPKDEFLALMKDTVKNQYQKKISEE